MVVKNILEAPEYRHGDWTLADKLIQENWERFPDGEGLSDFVNKAHYRELLSGRKYQRMSERNAYVEELAAGFEDIVVLDRMEYVCNHEDEVCYAVSDKLDKFFYDYGHQSLEGSRFFAERADSLNWFSLE